MNIHRGVYTTSDALDRELAELGYAAVAGWPDQRPVTPSLVRSRLRPPHQDRATVLLTARTPRQALIGAAALRFPVSRYGTGRLWGPLVHPTHRRHGLGRQLLKEMTDLIRTQQPAIRVTTAEIPAARSYAGAFYRDAGWWHSGTALLLKAILRPTINRRDDNGANIRPLQPEEDITTELAALYETTHPETDSDTIAGTFHRWNTDERFTPDCLLLARDPDNNLHGAALIYPLAHTDPTEATEALIADLLVSPDAPDPDRARRRLLRAAMAAGRRHNATVARAVIDTNDTETLAVLGDHGFATVDELHYYAPPTGPEPRVTSESILVDRVMTR